MLAYTLHVKDATEVQIALSIVTHMFSYDSDIIQW